MLANQDVANDRPRSCTRDAAEWQRICRAVAFTLGARRRRGRRVRLQQQQPSQRARPPARRVIRWGHGWSCKRHRATFLHELGLALERQAEEHHRLEEEKKLDSQTKPAFGGCRIQTTARRLRGVPQGPAHWRPPVHLPCVKTIAEAKVMLGTPPRSC